MARVEAVIDEVDLDNDDGYELLPGVMATCGRCGHTTESYGTGDASKRRCLALLREECPQGEINYYVEA